MLIEFFPSQSILTVTARELTQFNRPGPNIKTKFGLRVIHNSDGDRHHILRHRASLVKAHPHNCNLYPRRLRERCGTATPRREKGRLKTIIAGASLHRRQIRGCGFNELRQNSKCPASGTGRSSPGRCPTSNECTARRRSTICFVVSFTAVGKNPLGKWPQSVVWTKIWPKSITVWRVFSPES